MKAKDLENKTKEIMNFLDTSVKVEVEEGEKKDSTWSVKIEGDNSGLLIGRHGETLEAVQYLLRLIASKMAGERFPLAVDIGKYKESKNKELEELAIQVAENVKNSGYGQTMRPMNAYERRVVHVALKGYDGVEAISTGEEPYRCIEVKPKK